MEKQHQFQLWVLVIIIAALALLTKPAKAANEYLQYGGGHCQSATLEPYIEKSTEDSLSINGGDSSYNNNSDRDSLRFGIRLSIPLGSTCTKKYKQTMMTNELLKQQLEMLKLCARYQGLELGEEFAEVRTMCAGVRKKTEVTNDE
jgi:hypothetical protein